MSNQVKGRIFIVGCARSGTTLLQSLLAAHPVIVSFPETQFYRVLIGQLHPRMYGRRNRLRSLVRGALEGARLHLGLAYPNAMHGRARLVALLTAIGREELVQDLGPTGLSLKRCSDEFVQMLDRLARDDGMTHWVEKSPNHLYYIREIERYVATPKFLHIVRDGEDVVASLCDAAKKYSGGHDFTDNIDNCIMRWNSAIHETLRYRGRQNHMIVRYEQLVENLEVALLSICQFLGVTYTDQMIACHDVAASAVMRDTEKWKFSVSGEIKNANRTKFLDMFGAEQRDYISQRLESTSIL